MSLDEYKSEPEKIPVRGVERVSTFHVSTDLNLADLESKQRAVAGLASQGRATIIANGMDADELALIAASMTPDGKATDATAAACQQAIRSYYDRNKATGDEVEPHA